MGPRTVCTYLCTYVCVYVRTYVCMYECMYACIHVCDGIVNDISVGICIHACLFVFMYVCFKALFGTRQVWMDNSTHERVCMHACMYECACACMYSIVSLHHMSTSYAHSVTLVCLLVCECARAHNDTVRCVFFQAMLPNKSSMAPYTKKKKRI